MLLQLAVVDGHVKLVKALLDMGVYMEVTDEDGLTPLPAHRHGKTPLPAHRHGKTPLYIAAGCILQQARGANVEATDCNSWRPLNRAVENGDDEVVRILLQFGASTEARTINGETPLHCAAKWGHVKQVKMLIDKGANVVAENRYGQTPLRLARSHGHTEVIKVLWEKFYRRAALSG